MHLCYVPQFMPNAIQQHSRVRQSQWTSTLDTQVATWRQRTMEATRASFNVGLTLEGAAVTATGAAATCLQDVTQGAPPCRHRTAAPRISA